MAWRAARSLTWAGDGNKYEYGDVVPVDVTDPHLWWIMRAGLFIVSETVDDLPPGASPYSFDYVIIASNNRIDRFLASKAAAASVAVVEPEPEPINLEPEPELVSVGAVATETAPKPKKPAAKKAAAKKTTKKAATP